MNIIDLIAIVKKKNKKWDYSSRYHCRR